MNGRKEGPAVTADGVIFDLDGTLWDSTDACAIAYNEAIRSMEDPAPAVTADDLKKLFGLPNEVIQGKVFQGVPPEEQSRLMDRALEAEFRCLRAFPPVPYDGVRETLEALRPLPLFIVSNCGSGYIELFLELTGLGEFFTAHLCPGDTGRLKADNIRTVADRYGLTAPVYVGDTQGDGDAARAAGVPLIFAAYGFGQVSGAAARIARIRDLPGLLGR